MINMSNAGLMQFSNLTDVELSNLQDGQVPTYNSQTGKWENAEGGSGGAEIDDTTTASDKTWSSQKINLEISQLSGSFAGLTDVVLSNVQDGQVPKYNSSTGKWENADDDNSGTWGSITGTLSNQTDLQSALDDKQDVLTEGAGIDIANDTIALDIEYLTASRLGFIPADEKGVNNGIATLNDSGKIPSSQLPSYVDDVLEFSTFSEFPGIGESGKIYVALDTNQTYRWGGSSYVEISESLALGETQGTAYEGSKGKANADAISGIQSDLDDKYDTGDTAETTLDDADFVPFYDSSVPAKRKTLWSNIKAKLKEYFDILYAPLGSNAWGSITGTLSAQTDLQTALNNKVITLTKAQYDALTTEQKNDPTKVYYVSDYTPQYTLVEINEVLRAGVTASAGASIRIPESGTNGSISTSSTCFIKPICDAKSDGTPYKFISCVASDGYATIKIAEAVSNVEIGVQVINF